MSEEPDVNRRVAPPKHSSCSDWGSNMDGKVLLFHDQNEQVVAEVLRECMAALANECLQIKLVSQADAAEVHTWKHEPTPQWNQSIIFILCSPYSVSRPWVNFSAGAVTMLTEKTGSNSPKIIPICHAGQAAHSLPHYLLSRQALDIWHDSFVDALRMTLEKELRKQVRPQDLNPSRKQTYLNLLRKPEYAQSKICIPDKLSDESHLPSWRLSRQDSTVTIGELTCATTNDRADILTRMHRFLEAGSVTNCEPPVCAPISIGWQYCLVDRNGEFYVGLKRRLEVDPEFAAYSKDVGTFEPGYQTVAQGEDPESALNRTPHDNDFPGKILNQTEPHESILAAIQKRSAAMGHGLWDVRLGRQKYIASVFVNRSAEPPELSPRFEIGIWTIIEESSMADAPRRPRPKRAPHSEPAHFWIWVKDGVIHYWSYPDLYSIPRFKPLARCDLARLGLSNEINPRLIPTDRLREHFWRLDRYTPFAADDDRRSHGELVSNRFSSSAASLLSCF